MFPSSSPLQGGTGISLKPVNPQPVSKVQVQGPSPQTLLEPVYVGGGGGGGGGYTPPPAPRVSTGGTSQPAYAPAPPPPPPPDPFARWGGKANYDALVNSINASLGNVKTSGAEAFGSLKTNLYSGADDLIDNVTTGQKGIDHARENVELNRLRSVGDLIDYVRSGIRQGATRLAGWNSLDSSGADGIARMYANLGNKEARNVGNKSFLENRDIDLQQDTLNTTRTSGEKKLQRFKESETQRIGSEVRQKLATLDEQVIGNSLPNRVSVDREKQSVIDEGLRQLSEVDRYLGDKLGAIHPEDGQAVGLSARNLLSAGAPSTNPFAMDLPIATGFSPLGGPPLDQLPIFAKPKKTT